MDDCPYDADYFERGEATGKSLYTAYSWKPDLTIPMVKAIVKHCGIAQDDRILDFGCAKGFTVKAFKQLGYNAFGMDCSSWAIDTCDGDVTMSVWHGTRVEQDFDWIIAKDVMEHVEELRPTIDDFQLHARKGIFVVVPLGFAEKYVVPEYEKDCTHIWRETLWWWASKFMAPGWAVTTQYRVEGIKDNYSKHVKGNGFLVARRI